MRVFACRRPVGGAWGERRIVVDDMPSFVGRMFDAGSVGEMRDVRFGPVGAACVGRVVHAFDVGFSLCG